MGLYSLSVVIAAIILMISAYLSSPTRKGWLVIFFILVCVFSFLQIRVKQNDDDTNNANNTLLNDALTEIRSMHGSQIDKDTLQKILRQNKKQSESNISQGKPTLKTQTKTLGVEILSFWAERLAGQIPAPQSVNNEADKQQFRNALHYAKETRAIYEDQYKPRIREIRDALAKQGIRDFFLDMVVMEPKLAWNAIAEVGVRLKTIAERLPDS